MKRLDGHKALITGGTSGVGAAIALAAAEAGADIMLLGLRKDAHAESTVDACRRYGVTVECLACDLARPPSEYLDELLADIEARMTGIDLLVNNAGIYVDVPFFEMDYARYESTIQLNVTAGYFLTQAFARRWVKDQIAGRVLFTGSINGLLAEQDHTAYDTSKGAVAAMVRSLCVSLAPHQIRVNSMAPGLVRTPLTGPAIDSGGLEAWMQLHTPNGKVPDASACAGTAVFLLSDEAEHVHGQTIYVDGGMSAWQQPDPPAASRD
ncbi:MAG: SDR family oxidoreductase [Planctomycetota bacterium]